MTLLGAPFDGPTWWVSLNHGGMLIAPVRLVEHFVSECPPLPRHLADRLRRDLLRFRSGAGDQLSALLDTVLEDVLGLARAQWTKGSDIETRWSHKALTGEIIKPRRIWQAGDGLIFPVFVADLATTRDRYSDEGRLGIGRGRRPVSRVVEWLRRSGEKVALLTNGRQWRLIHAGADYEAWCEWDTDLWFEEGSPGPQVTALRILLGKPALQVPRPGELPPLVAAILASRRGQAELSAALGERVRLAVEILIRESAAALSAIDGDGPGHVSRRNLYIAATRLVMRCVVVLFAEARDLLPRDNPIYHECYGAQGLREQLARLAGGRAERLRDSYCGWPRLLALFRLIHEGSPHEALPIPRYGGGLFAPGDRTSKDAVLRALAAFEDPGNAPTDAAIHEILELLCVSKVKVRQGRSNTWVPAPVNFSDLSSEYIGILYEGLLDFELHRAPEHDAVVFLRLGDEPALPLSRLEEEMAPERLAELIGKLKKTTKKLAAAEGEDEEDEAAEEEQEEGEAPEEEVQPEEPAVEEPSGGVAAENAGFDIVREVRERAEIWAEKAVKEAKLVPYPRRDDDATVRDRWAEEVRKRARALYRLVLPGQWYLVRWGGTRKGAGTFYTRPQLAVPTARRALQPLCYEPAEQVTDEATGLTTVTNWAPRRPEEILALKVCDPAMGSGSFLVAALRYLTDALVESLHFHKRLHARPDGAICKLADGLPLDHPSQETVPVPLDHPEFDDRLRARLKRHVVEQCIYGVDIDPLAVELARMALWVETMDRRLPFGFLDHKLRCGNSLVGCWFDRFQDYPVMAFQRDDAGDKNHDRFVHHFREYTIQRGRRKGEVQRSGDVWTQRWKQVQQDVIAPQIRAWIEAHGSQAQFPFARDGHTAEGIHDESLAVFRELHDLPVHEVERREVLHREKISGNPALARLREAFDAWCAIWFWPGDKLDLVPTPKNFQDPPEATRAIVAHLLHEYGFFHWEIEFPDVFTGSASGFDAVVGNPPWDTVQQNAPGFFSNLDPLYRTYTKEEAANVTHQLFTNSPNVEDDWLRYCERLAHLTHWYRNVASPFGNSGSGTWRFTSSSTDDASLHAQWEKLRLRHHGYTSPGHPFTLQGGGKPYTFRLFAEIFLALDRPTGRVGAVLPSALYSDKGSVDLRKTLFDAHRWEWLFDFENHEGIFDIDRRAKFSAVVLQRGQRTVAVRTSFMQRQLIVWEEAERSFFPYPVALVRELSPDSLVLTEFSDAQGVTVLRKLYTGAVKFGDRGIDSWGLRYSREFNMSDDAGLFKPTDDFVSDGFLEDGLGILARVGREAAFPFLEGRGVDSFRSFAMRWVRGRGRRAVWEPIRIGESRTGAQFYMPVSRFIESAKFRVGPKVGVMDVTAATNSRTVIAACLPEVPTGHSVNNAQVRGLGVHDTLVLCAILNSFVFDFCTRLRLSGQHVSDFFLRELPLPRLRRWPPGLVFSILRLNCVHPLFARWWGLVRQEAGDKCPEYKRSWATTEHERTRLRVVVDAVIAELYGLAPDDLAWLLRECDFPVSSLRSKEFRGQLFAKGFWRVDKEKHPELRHTVLTRVAFRGLKRVGLDAFLSLNDGEGWMVPETLRLADYGLGHDDRAKEAQPVAPRLGPRFVPWQLEQTAKASWEECERHAERLEALLGRPLATGVGNEQAPPPDASKPADLFGQPLYTDLFGNVVPGRTSRRRRGR